MSQTVSNQGPHCVVTANALNLRSRPVIANGNVLASLHQGQVLRLLDDKDLSWWAVGASFGARAVEGFAKAEYLRLERDAPELQTYFGIVPVDFPADARARLDATDARHCPMPDTGFVRRPLDGDAARKVQALDRLVDLLNVEHSARYLPTAGSTYCNVYAYDFCHFAEAYLPRVWWKPKALLALAANERLAVRYDDTVQELNANALYDWLCDWGAHFEWVRVFDVTELQDKVNQGCVGVICAKRRELSRSGHITVVIPETDKHHVDRRGTSVVAPLQSQAGARNKQRFTNQWWVDRATEYSATGFWFHA